MKVKPGEYLGVFKCSFLQQNCLEDNRSIVQLASETCFIRPVMGQLQKQVKHGRRQKSVICLQGEIGAVNVNPLASLPPQNLSFITYSHVALCISQFQVLASPTPSLGDPGAFDQNFSSGAEI